MWGGERFNKVFFKKIEEQRLFLKLVQLHFLVNVFSKNNIFKNISTVGRLRPRVLVMGGDSCSKGHGFESRHRILDGHVFTYICCKNSKDV